MIFKRRTLAAMGVGLMLAGTTFSVYANEPQKLIPENINYYNEYVMKNVVNENGDIVGQTRKVVPILYEYNNVKIIPRSIEYKSEEITINAKIPSIQGLIDEEYQEKLNDELINEVLMHIIDLEKQASIFAEDSKMNGWEVRPFELLADYNVKTNKDILSFTVTIFENTGGTGNPVVKTYNILNEAKAKQITLEELFGEKYKEIINEDINKQIQQNKDRYFEGDMGFKSISDNQNFYIENGKPVIVFNKYEIAPGSEGMPEFRITKTGDNNSTSAEFNDEIIINGEKLNLQNAKPYYKDEKILMVPLRLVAEKLGYNVKWVDETCSVELQKGNIWTSIKIGKDSYFFARMAPETLGAAPEIKNNLTYVPISFFEKILHEKLQ